MPHLSDAQLDHLVGEVDVDHVALALVVIDEDHLGVPVGVARMIRYWQQPTAADVAVTVLDQWHGRGVATALLDELMRQRPAGITELVTTITADNARLWRCCAAWGGPRSPRRGQPARRGRRPNPARRGRRESTEEPPRSPPASPHPNDAGDL